MYNKHKVLEKVFALVDTIKGFLKEEKDIERHLSTGTVESVVSVGRVDQ